MPTAKAGDTVSIPLVIAGEFTAGDPTTQPDQSTRLLQNYVFRPNRVDGRPPFVNDGAVSGISDVVRYFAIEDLANKVRRTLCGTHAGTLLQKNSAGSVVGADWTLIGSVTGTNNYLSMSDYANLLGQVYVMLCDDSGTPLTGPVPTTQLAFSYDGTNISVTPFDAAITSRTITAFVDRYFLGHAKETITPQLAGGTLSAAVYDMTNALWDKQGMTAKNITANGITRSRLYLTSATAAEIAAYTIASPSTGLASFAATDTVRTLTYRANLFNNHASYNMPVTQELVLVTDWQAAHAYAAGDLISDSASGGHHLQRCTTAGTSGAVHPAWATTVGATTADGAGALSWTNEGSDILGSTVASIPNATTATDFTTLYVSAKVPPATNTLSIAPKFKFYTTATPTITLASIDMSLKDGLADGDHRKANRGQQVTLSEYFYDFVNTETATSRTAEVEDIVFTENNQPRRILAKDTVSMPEVAGYVTAVAVVGGRLVAFKRRGMWQFAATSDPNVPIIPERPASVDYGCIGPRAIDVYRDELFWIDEHEVFRMKLGEEPKPICGPGMREVILNKATDTTATTGWIENFGAGQPHTPYLCIDKANHDVWVLTQQKRIYIFNLDTEQWSTLQFYDGSGIDGRFAAIFFDTLGQRMLMSVYGENTTRFDETSSAKDNPLVSNSITNDLIFKPIEAFAPDRFELELDGVNLYHNATGSQTGDTLTLQYSLDRGTTWTTPAGYPVTVDVSDPLIPLPIIQSGHSIMLRILRTGNGGAAQWSISKASAKIKVTSGEYYYATATS